MKLHPLLLLFLGLFLLALPWILLLGAGLLKLYEHSALLLWAIAFAVCWLLAWWALDQAGKRRVLQRDLQGTLSPEDQWSEVDLEAWQLVLQIASSIENEERKVKTLHQAQELFLEILNVVAAYYHPTAKEPRLEVPLRDVLIVQEQASSELRSILREALPLHHALTINDLLRLRRGFNISVVLHNIYRSIRAVGSPVSALLAELRDVLANRAVQSVSRQTSAWILARFVEGVGKHSINLYSGQVFDPAALEESSVGDLRTKFIDTPIRVLLLGESNAGKSSFINSVFKSEQTSVHHLPETETNQLFKVALEEGGTLIFVDTPGLEERKGFENSKFWREELQRADVLLLFTPANSASRVNLLRILEQFRTYTASTQMPPIVVALTKVDLLRPFNSWDPPYNLNDPQVHQERDKQVKAINMQLAISAVSDDLSIPSEQIVPIFMGPNTEPYNVDTLLLVLCDALPEARRKAWHRLLREYRKNEHWDSLARSLEFGGRLIVSRGVETLLASMRKALEGSRGSNQKKSR